MQANGTDILSKITLVGFSPLYIDLCKILYDSNKPTDCVAAY